MNHRHHLPLSLRLDPHARIIPGEDILHVFSRSGIFDLRGKNLHRVHDRIAPALDGRFTEVQILAAAGPQTALAKRYLTGLRDAGLLLKGGPSSPLPLGLPVPVPEPQRFEIDGFRLAVGLDGIEEEWRADLRLLVLDQVSLERRILSLGVSPERVNPTDRTDRIWIVADSPATPGELARRAAIARYLLAIEWGRREAAQGDRAGKRLNVFSLAPVGFSLQRLAVIDPPAVQLDTLPQQLKLVRMLDQPQLPLVGLVAALPGLGCRRVGYGLDQLSVRTGLILDLLGREALVHRTANGALRMHRTRLGARAPNEEFDWPGDRSDRMICASSATELAERLLLQWASHIPYSMAQRVDLLSLAAPSKRVATLQAALRRRLGSLPAWLNLARGPLIRLRLEPPETSVAALSLETALSEALLRRLALETGLAEPCSQAYLAVTSNPSFRRRRLRAALAVVTAAPEIQTGRDRLLGRPLFFGFLSEEPTSL